MSSTTMEAGRELDARVGEKVMGQDMEVRPAHEWRPLWEGMLGAEDRSRICNRCGLSTLGEHEEGGSCRIFTPPYSTDISAAWEVVEALIARGLYVKVEDGYPADSDERAWHCRLHHGFSWEDAWAPTAPLAICRAALAALAALEG